MTKAEVLAALAAKMQANRAEVRRQLEFIATIPGWGIHDGNVDLLHQLSVTWKEGQGIREVAADLVGIVYEDEQAPDPEKRLEHALS